MGKKVFQQRISIAKSLCSVFVLIISLYGCAPSQSVNESGSQGGYAWPPPPATPRIKWLAQWSDKNDFGKSQILTFLVGEERAEKLRRPEGIVVDSAGNIYVADSELHIIFVFDQEHRTLRFLGFGTLKVPVGLAIDNKRGILFVSDAGVRRVFGLDKNSGNLVMTIGLADEFISPSGMAYDDERGKLYVSDTRNHVIKVFDKDGRLLSTMGKRGDGDGEFNFPSFLAVDKNGWLYVVDSFNFRIQIFDADGKFITKFGKLGDSSGYLARPNGIGVDSDGHIYVVDASFNNFQIFNQEGRLLLWIGGAGKKPGQFYLPSGMYIDKNDKIYVSDTFNRRVQVFQYLKENMPAKTADNSGH
jgi:DNA-binding beta-propeller fold protein YncE